MFDFLDAIRKKPEAARRRILHASVGVSFVVVMAVWFGTLDGVLSPEPEQEVADRANSPVQTLSQTASAFFSGVGQAFDQGRDSYNQIRSQMQESDIPEESEAQQAPESTRSENENTENQQEPEVIESLPAVPSNE